MLHNSRSQIRYRVGPVLQLIGASVSEPHIDEFDVNFLYFYISIHIYIIYIYISYVVP